MSTTFSSRPRVLSRRWTRICESIRHHRSIPNVLISFPSEKKDLDQLSALGHFLKGSSATLGLTKVKDSCEKIQHFGAKKDESGSTEITADVALDKLRHTIAQAKVEFSDAERALRKFYHDE